jgi:Flp pilus assembly protein TadG
VSGERLRSERGSALLLMPAGVLVVIILGALAVDSAVLFLGERELADLTAAAANDAATAGLDAESFYGCGALRVDEARARDVVGAVIAARSSDAVEVTGVGVTVDNSATTPEVTVSARGTVQLVFTPAIPGTVRTRAVDARSTAAARSLGPDAAAGGDCPDG